MSISVDLLAELARHRSAVEYYKARLNEELNRNAELEKCIDEMRRSWWQRLLKKVLG